jgi:PRTRC genetic system protein A
MFFNHLHATQGDLPPCGPYLCEYFTASNGVFVRARRPGLEALLPVCLNFNGPMRGLRPLQPYVRLEAGPIPASLIARAIARMVDCAPQERLVWITGGDAYSLVEPEQSASASRCQPLDPFHPAGQNALLDFHSHGVHPPFYSPTDDRDESQGFRLYAVAGCFPRPKILVRVGVYGHFWQIPPEWVIDLPEGLVWAMEGCLPCLD